MSISKFRGRTTAGGANTQRQSAPQFRTQYSGYQRPEDDSPTYPVYNPGSHQTALREPSPQPPEMVVDNTTVRLEELWYGNKLEDWIDPPPPTPITSPMPIDSLNYIHACNAYASLISTLPTPTAYAAPISTMSQQKFCKTRWPAFSLGATGTLWSPKSGELWIPFFLVETDRTIAGNSNNVYTVTSAVHTIRSIGMWYVNLKNSTVSILWQQSTNVSISSANTTVEVFDIAASAPAEWKWLFNDYVLFTTGSINDDCHLQFNPWFPDSQSQMQLRPGWLSNPEIRRKSEKRVASRYLAVNPNTPNQENSMGTPSTWNDNAKYLLNSKFFVNENPRKTLVFHNPTESYTNYQLWRSYNPNWAKSLTMANPIRKTGKSYQNMFGNYSTFIVGNTALYLAGITEDE